MKDTAERLVEIYNQIDRLMENGEEHYVSFVRRVRELSERDPLYARYRDELILLAEIRNLLVHNTYADLVSPVCYPHEKLLARFEEILSHISAPSLALDTVALTQREIYSVRPETKVLSAIRHMHLHGFSHAPVIKNGYVVGIFSEQSVFAYTALHGTSPITEDMPVSALHDMLSLSDYKQERYTFVSKSATVYDVLHRFEHSLANGVQTRVIFITDNGTATGKLLGMVTPMNMLNYRP